MFQIARILMTIRKRCGSLGQFTFHLTYLVLHIG